MNDYVSLKHHFYMAVVVRKKFSKGLLRHARIQRGVQEVRTPPPLPPPENHKNIGFLRNTGPDPLKITKLPSQHSMLGHHRHASETPFNGVSLAGR